MTHSIWQDQSFHQNYDCDFAIIGAGIAGLSTAYWLSHYEPDLKIIVLDKQDVGYGASGRNAGFMTCGSVSRFRQLEERFGIEKAQELWSFSEQNHHLLYEHFIHDHIENLDYRKCGSVTVAKEQEDYENILEAAEWMESSNFDIERVSKKDLAKSHGLKGFLGGVKINNDASINPMRLLQVIKERTMKLSKNVEFLMHQPVFSVRDEGESSTLTTQRSIIRAKRVVYACNGYTRAFKDDLSQWIKPRRGQILLTDKLDPILSNLVYFPKEKVYLQQLKGGEIIIGGARAFEKDPDDLSDRVTPEVQKALEDFLSEHLGLKAVEVQSRWAGLMGFTETELPFVINLPKHPRHILFAGFSGHGMGLAFNFARILAQKEASLGKV